MILKTTSLCFSTLSLFYYWFLILLDNGVTATIHIPDHLKPGETITAEVIIKKGNINGFAKLQIETGSGISITEEDDSKGAAFSSSGNTAKWIWTALPIEAEFKIKFKVTTSPSFNGNSSISGKFSYIVNNTKQVAEIPAKNIIIGDKTSEPITQNIPTSPPSAAPPANTQSITTSTTPPTSITTTTSAPTENTKVSVSRTIQNIAPHAWLIKITINKGPIRGFARYTDVLPKDLSAKVEEKDGSSFFIDGDNIKFVWSTLPEKESVIISYKLSGNVAAPLTLNGDFSYTENNQVLNKTLSPDILQPTSLSDNNTSQPVTPPTQPSNIAETTTQAKQTKIFFSVQLGAFLKSRVGPYYFSNKYNIQNIKQEQHESYKKFYSGNFDKYKQARDYREEIKTKGIQDAFVIAHKNNVRITVQEALMIANQKWYP